MRNIKLFIGIVSILFAALAGAQEIREGKDYKVFNPPQPTEAGKGKVEVVEFFWYGCPHCFELEPLLVKWRATLPKDVVFRRVPALFPNGRWAPETKLYYTLEAMGLVEKLHQDVFDAIHIDRIRMNEESTMLAWLEKKGVDRKAFADTYASFAIQSKTQRSIQLAQAYQLEGVPALAVNGKYMRASGAAGGYEDMLALTDKLIAKARADMGLPDPGAADAKAKKDSKKKDKP